MSSTFISDDLTKKNFNFSVEERPKHSVASRNPPGCQTSRRISRTSRRSSSIGCRSLMIGRRSSAGLLAWTSCQDPSRVTIYNKINYIIDLIRLYRVIFLKRHHNFAESILCVFIFKLFLMLFLS